MWSTQYAPLWKRKKAVWPIWIYSPQTCLQECKSITKRLGQKARSHRRDLNPVPYELRCANLLREDSWPSPKIRSTKTLHFIQDVCHEFCNFIHLMYLMTCYSVSFGPSTEHSTAMLQRTITPSWKTYKFRVPGKQINTKSYFPKPISDSLEHCHPAATVYFTVAPRRLKEWHRAGKTMSSIEFW
jgi:hypothetical protein